MRISCLPKAECCAAVCLLHVLSVRTSLDGHWGCFHLLAIVSNASVSIGVQGSLSDTPPPPVQLFGVYTDFGIIREVDVQLLRNLPTVSPNINTVLYSHRLQRVSTSLPPHQHVLRSFCDNSPPNGCEVCALLLFSFCSSQCRRFEGSCEKSRRFEPGDRLGGVGTVHF